MTLTPNRPQLAHFVGSLKLPASPDAVKPGTDKKTSPPPLASLRSAREATWLASARPKTLNTAKMHTRASKIAYCNPTPTLLQCPVNHPKEIHLRTTIETSLWLLDGPPGCL